MIKNKTQDNRWKMLKLKDITEINPQSSKLPDYFNYIDLESVKRGRLINIQVLEKVKAPSRAQRVLSKGDVLFQTVRPYQKNNLFFDLKEGDYVASTGYALLRSNFNNKFLYYLISSNYFVKEVLRRCVGSNYPAITSEDLRTISVKIPSSEEQKAIVSVIEEWDKYIELLDKKILIKKDIKKYLTQELLNGNKRLKGFDNKWEIKKLGEMGYFKTSSIDKKIYEGQKLVYLINYMDVYKHKRILNSNKNSLMRVSAKDEQINNNNLLKGDILFTPSSETPDDIGHSIVILEDLIDTLYSYHLVRFRPSFELDLGFSHYFCNQDMVLRQCAKYSCGVTRFTLSMDSFSRIEVRIPPIEEQKSISLILSKSDKEIAMLEKQKDIIGEQRKYLLNNLVTGNLRVKL